VFENRVLRRVFGPKRDETTGEWRQLHNEELNDLYSLPNILRVVKSRILIWRGMWHLSGKREVCTGCWWENQWERGHWGYPDVDGRIILKWIFSNFVKFTEEIMVVTMIIVERVVGVRRCIKKFRA
jgi:hypothetical protein